jgi:TetR/AcrR family transcriptional repressor of nem operon
MRDHLLSSALETLHRRGFNATGVQDITQAAGLPKGSFYNYFKSKEALALEVIDRYGKDQMASAAILSDESLSPLERLRRYFVSIWSDLAAENRERGCLLGNFSTELADQSRPIRDRLSAHFAAWSRQIESCVRDAQKAGEISSEVDPHVLAGFLLNSFEGAVLRMKVEKDDSPQKNFMDVIFSRVLA